MYEYYSFNDGGFPSGYRIFVIEKKDDSYCWSYKNIDYSLLEKRKEGIDHVTRRNGIINPELLSIIDYGLEKLEIESWEPRCNRGVYDGRDITIKYGESIEVNTNKYWHAYLPEKWDELVSLLQLIDPGCWNDYKKSFTGKDKLVIPSFLKKNND